jgi:3-keto-5-aminohexanoate cleavage enzyme
MRKVVIEARINEYEPRDRNPNVPWTAAEIAADAKACVAAGASVVHFHARKPDGAPDHSYEGYRDVMAAVRDATDVMVHVTLGAQTHGGSAESRLDHVLRLVDDGLKPEFAPLDMLSTNADMFDPVANRFVTDTIVYQNSTATLRYFAEKLREVGVMPQLEAWTIPALRWIDAFHRAGHVTAPLSIGLPLTEGGAMGGHPGTEAGLRAFVDFLPREIEHLWSVSMFQGNLLPLVPYALERGGHISIGIGDHPYPELGHPTNAALIAETARIVRDAGCEVATVAEARALFGFESSSRT